MAVENLDTKRLIELDGDSQNRAGAAWGTFRRVLEYKCECGGTHFVAVEPDGTTKECAASKQLGAGCSESTSSERRSLS